MKRSVLWLPVLVTGVVFLLAGCTGADTDPSRPSGGNAMPGPMESSASSTFLGMQPPTPYAMPDLTLEDTSGRPFNLVTDTTDPVTLVFFGYTNCPTVCPLVMSDLAVALTKVSPQVRDMTQVVFVTTDPARDTPSVIRSYLDHYDPTFIGLTGPMNGILAAAGDLDVAIDGKKMLVGGGYDVGHGAQIIGFIHDEAPVVWPQGTPVSALVADIDELARS